MMSRTRLLWGILAAAMAGSFLYYSLGEKVSVQPQQTAPPSQQPQPDYGQVPEFTLTDETGQPFGSSQLRGKIWLADFIFTSCAGQCPRMTEQMRLMQQRLPQSVQMVSITADPQRDTPPVLAQYAARQGAQAGRWHFLTGPKPTIEKLILQGFHLGYADGGPPEEPIIHSVRFMLVDRQGKIRGAYDATDPAALDRLVQDVQELSR